MKPSPTCVASQYLKKAAVLVPQEWMDAQVAEVQAYLDRPVPQGTVEEAATLLEGLRDLLLSIPDRLRQFTDSPYVFGHKMPDELKRSADSVSYQVSLLLQNTRSLTKYDRDRTHPLDDRIRADGLRKVQKRLRTVRDALNTTINVYGFNWDRLVRELRAASPSINAGDLSALDAIAVLRDPKVRGRLTKVVSFEDSYSGDPVEAVKAFFESLRSTWERGGPLPEDRGIFREVSLGKARLTILDPDVQVEIDERVIERCLQAKRLLERRGLGEVWYGPILYMSQKPGRLSKEIEAEARALGYEAAIEAGIAGQYSSSKDTVYLYVYPSDQMVGTLVHELGHRYWARFMDQRGRAHFTRFVRTPAITYEGETEGGEVDEWGREKPVAPVSQYGGTNIEEAFAEAFSAYVLGSNFSWGASVPKMNRDQLESFKSVIEG